MNKKEQLVNESALQLMDEIDDILDDYGLNLVAPEDLDEYDKSKEDGNTAAIYGCIYYAIEDAVKVILRNILNDYKKRRVSKNETN